MSDGHDCSPSPRRKLTRERRQRIIPGATPWADTEDSEGAETPDADTPHRDPSYRPRRTYRRAGAGSARHGHSDQEAPATPRHYSQDTQGARSQEGPATMDNVGCTLCHSPEHLDQNCPQQTCSACGGIGHHALYCNHESPAGQHTLSEIAQETPSPPGAGDRSRDQFRLQQDPGQQQQQDLAQLQERQRQATLEQQQEHLRQLELQRAQEEQDRQLRQERQQHQELHQVRGAEGGVGHVPAPGYAAPMGGAHQGQSAEQQEHLRHLELQRAQEEQDVAQRRQQQLCQERQQRQDPHQARGTEGLVDHTPAAIHSESSGGVRQRGAPMVHAAENGNAGGDQGYEAPASDASMDHGQPSARLPPKLVRDVPARSTPETMARPGEPDADYGTFT